ncbi:DEAD/DEAH box helicase family protein [Chryseobacterium phage MA9V-2]|nr:DEAD/DEAH box helicase family protein [Chryseobacterium phage MA9V-2]
MTLESITLLDENEEFLPITAEQVDFIITTLTNDKLKLRESQPAIVAQIFNNLVTKKRQLLVAPTGSGKSFIAFALSLLYKHFGDRKTFIITNTKQLQSQYEEDAEYLNLSFGNITGIDNYKCSVNGDTYSLGHCNVNLGMKTIAQKKTLDCYANCDYLQKRTKSAKSHISVMNYSYWLIQQNYVKDRMHNHTFATRPLTIFDECHNIPDIVQNHFAVNLNSKYILGILADAGHHVNVGNVAFDNAKMACDIVNKSVDLAKISTGLQILQGTLSKYMNEFKKILADYQSSYDSKNFAVNRIMHNRMSAFDKIKDVHCKIEDYNELIAEHGIQYIVKDGDGETWSKLRFANDIALIALNVNKHTKHSLYMTATAGNAELLAKSLAFGDPDNYDIIEMETDWDFDKSPIYFVPGSGKLTFHQFDENIDSVISSIKDIAKTHKNENGLIHSRSYKLTEMLSESFRGLKLHAIQTHFDSAGKLEALNAQKNVNKPSIVISPSMHEGTNFNDDMARFQIMAKMPYANPHDKLIRRRKKFMPEYMELSEAIHIVQALGRPVRHKDDFCTTYLVDASFSKELGKLVKHFPNLKSRLKVQNEKLNEIAKASGLSEFTALMALCNHKDNETAYFSKEMLEDGNVKWTKFRIRTRKINLELAIDESFAIYDSENNIVEKEVYTKTYKVALNDFVEKFIPENNISQMHSPFFKTTEKLEFAYL